LTDLEQLPIARLAGARKLQQGAIGIYKFVLVHDSPGLSAHGHPMLVEQDIQSGLSRDSAGSAGCSRIANRGILTVRFPAAFSSSSSRFRFLLPNFKRLLSIAKRESGSICSMGTTLE
jgi:hypothetical protein